MLYIKMDLVTEIVTEVIDTVDMILRRERVPNANFAGTADYLQNRGRHEYERGGRVINTGYLPSIHGQPGHDLKVKITDVYIKLGEASLCKWFYGDNFHTFSIGDIRECVEALCDILHLPIHEADITRLDIGHNLVMECPVNEYLNHCGELEYFKRQYYLDEGICYTNSQRQHLLYDKVKEQKIHKLHIPVEYRNQNVLRMEHRFLERLPRHFKKERVTAGMLSNDVFYMEYLHQWAKCYRNINKMNDIANNFKIFKTKREMYQHGLVCMVQQYGGELSALKRIEESRLCGKLSRKQACDLKKTIIEACKSPLMTRPSDSIIELDAKVAETVEAFSC